MAGMQGVILAGGISSRMGFPKALMPVGNSFFLLAVYRQLADAGIKPVHMVINTGLKTSLDAQIGKFPEGRFVLNQAPNKGQIHSFQLGLQAAGAEGASHAVVTLVDLPFVDVETIARLMAASDASPDKIIIPQFEGKHGHPVIIPAARFDAFIQASESQTARDIMHAHPDWLKYVDVTDGEVLADIDSPEDLMSHNKQEKVEDDLD